MAKPTPPTLPNRAPTAVTLSSNIVIENADAGTDIGFITVADPNRGDTFTFSISDDRFEVVSDAKGKFVLQLADGAEIDYEAAPNGIPLSVTATDPGGLSKTQAFTILVTNVNEAPESIALSSSTVTENQAGAVVGTLSAIDPEGSPVAFSITDDRFEIVQTETGESVLKLKDGESVDYETSTDRVYPINITASDGTLSSAQTFRLPVIDDVADNNRAPESITISSSAVAENIAGAVIGELGAMDPNGDPITYSITDQRFEIIQNQAGESVLKLADGQSLDYEASEDHKYSIDVTASDGTLSSTQQLSLDITNDSSDDVVSGPNVIRGTEGNDELRDTVANDLIYGLGGDDGIMLTLGGSDVAYGDAGNDRISAYAQAATIYGGSGQDWVTLVNGVANTVDLGDANDVVQLNAWWIDSGGNSIVLGSGQDRIAFYPERVANPSMIKDFVAGSDGDSMELWTTTTPSNFFETNPFVSGHVWLEQAGADTVLMCDADAAGPNGAPEAGLMLEGVDAHSFTANNFFGWEPIVRGEDVNEAPTDVTLSSNTVTENVAGAVIGELSATDPDGDALTFSVSDDTFELVQNESGALLLKLKEGESLDYEASSDHTYPIDITASDGTLSSTQAFDIAISNDTADDVEDHGHGPGYTEIVGTEFDNNNLIGTEGMDHITGLAGNDFLDGRGGDDWLQGGEGNDLLKGGPGDDRLDGGQNSNSLIGDELYGEAGNDIIFIELGSSSVFGGDGDDRVFVDSYTGGDLIDLGPGNDLVRVRTPLTQPEAITTGTGQDTIELLLQDPPVASTVSDFSPGSLGDKITIQGLGDPFTSGSARLMQSGDDTVLLVDLDASGTDHFPATVLILEHVTATELTAENFGGDAPIIVDSADVFNEMVGTEFSDQIFGTDGNDHIVGLAGNDSLHGILGNDLVEGGLGDDVIYGGAGSDQLFGADGDDALYGADGDDNLTGGAGSNIIDGGSGDNRLTSEGNDSLVAGDGYNTVRLLGGDDHSIALGDGDNTVDSHVAGTVSIVVGAGNDFVWNNGGAAMTMDLGEGNNSFQQGNLGGSATITAAGGIDSVANYSGSVTANLGAGNDTYRANGGQATLTTGEGADTLYFNQWSGTDPALVVTDFSAEDVIDFNYFVDHDQLTGWDRNSNPFGDAGYMQLVQSDADTLWQIDRDGSGAAHTFQTAVVLEDVTATSLIDANFFPEFLLDGTEPAPLSATISTTDVM